MSRRHELWSRIRDRLKTIDHHNYDSAAITNDVMLIIDSFIEEHSTDTNGTDELKIGDRVKLIADDPDGNGDLVPDKSMGTVVGKSSYDDQPYLVEWDHSINMGHDGEELVVEGKYSKDGHGWWISSCVLQKIPF